MVIRKKAVIRDTRLFFLGYGFFVGLVFPVFYKLVLVNQSAVFFWLSCIGAGLLVGWLSFVVLKVQILVRLQALVAEMRLMQSRQQFHVLRHDFHPQDLFAQLLDHLNGLLVLRGQQYDATYRSVGQLISDRFKFNRRIHQFNDKLQQLTLAQVEIDQQVQVQQGQSREQLQIFLTLNRSIQQAAAALSEILEHHSKLELQLRQQDSWLRAFIQENHDVEAAATGRRSSGEHNGILELSLAFAHESDRSLRSQEERLEQISNLLQEIEDIAESTHLLSINASIEAARAGEAGRGFTIVALQIRNLATKSSGLTTAIREQTDSITELARSSTYALSDLRELLQSKNQELQECFQRIGQVGGQVEQLQQQIQPLFQLIRTSLEDLSSKMIQLNQVRDSGRQNLDQQQTAYQELRQKIIDIQGNFHNLKEIGEKGLFNETILRQLHENIRNFEAASQSWHYPSGESEADNQAVLT